MDSLIVNLPFKIELLKLKLFSEINLAKLTDKNIVGYVKSTHNRFVMQKSLNI